MGSLPRPLLALLAVVLIFFAAWTVVLRPHSNTSAPLTPANVPPITKLHRLQHKVPAIHTAAKPAVTGHAAARVHHAKPVADTATTLTGTPTQKAAELNTALSAGKVIALLFYNPAGADDQADVQALNGVPGGHGAVVKLAVPISEVATFSAVTDNVPVTNSPTLLVINRQHRTSTIIGYADPLEYDQTVAGAVAATK